MLRRDEMSGVVAIRADFEQARALPIEIRNVVGYRRYDPVAMRKTFTGDAAVRRESVPSLLAELRGVEVEGHPPP